MLDSVAVFDSALPRDVVEKLAEDFICIKGGYRNGGYAYFAGVEAASSHELYDLSGALNKCKAGPHTMRLSYARSSHGNRLVRELGVAGAAVSLNGGSGAPKKWDITAPAVVKFGEGIDDFTIQSVEKRGHDSAIPDGRRRRSLRGFLGGGDSIRLVIF